MKQKPLTKSQIETLKKNETVPEDERKPVVKFFTPWGAATWLISEYDPEYNLMFGLCDLGQGCPELGYVSLDELTQIKGPFGLTIERDVHFTPDKTLAEYAEDAREKGRIDA